MASNVLKMSLNDLIAEVKQYPQLYDEKAEDYKDKAAKRLLWDRITLNLCEVKDRRTVDKVKMKWKNLRDNYIKALKLYEKKKTLGLSPTLPKYYHELEFIRNHVKSRKSADESEDDGSQDKTYVAMDYESEEVPVKVECDDEVEGYDVEYVEDHNTISTAPVKGSVLTLLKEVKKRPQLYDDSIPEYKDPNLKNKLWEEVGVAVCGRTNPVTVVALKSKFKALRDDYIRTVNKNEKKQKDGLEVTLPKYHSELSFIVTKSKKRSPNKRKRSSFRDDTISKTPGNSTVNMTDAQFQDDSHDDPLDFEPLSEAAVSWKICEKRLRNDDSEQDEILAFFLSIAKTVKRLKPLNRAIVKKTIANVVLDVEIREATEAERNTNRTS